MRMRVIWLLTLIATVLPLRVEAQWERVDLPSPYDREYFLDVFFLPSNPQYGWASGFNGAVVRTTDGGKTWVGTRLPTGANQMESIHFVNPLLGWCSGTMPNRVYRTTDGGASWVDVTPQNAGDIWGCYFANDSIGVVVGGGCGNQQNFYRTTDGGDTWSVTHYNELASGLSDALLLSPFGLGYAISSGRLWRTTDGGVSWQIMTIIGPKHWQEELAKFGNSFLAPAAGNTCEGTGPGGEMFFSTDNGYSWISYSVGKPMFGAFLTGPTTGWGVGYDGTVIRTTNAGYSWQLLNCGVEGVDLDDIWFVNDTTAFIAGERGLYRMVWPPVKPLADTLVVDTLCIEETRTDTLWIRNFWRQTYPMIVTLIGSPAFRLRAPVPTTARSCDSTPIVVIFEPSVIGTHQAVVNVSFPTLLRSYTIPVQGEALPRVQYTLSTDTVIINPAACGTLTQGDLRIVPVNVDSFRVQLVERISGSNVINLVTELPARVPTNGAPIIFAADPPDTGWFETRFRIRINRCSPDTIVTVRAYGVSPIIQAPQRLHSIAACRLQDTVLVAVANTGNAPLHISAVTVSGPDADAVQGWQWQSNRGTTATIAPGTVDTLEVWVNVVIDQTVQFSLHLENNDRTRRRGRANPKTIAVRVQSIYPQLQIGPTTVDLGILCVGEYRDTVVIIDNVGNHPVEVEFRWTDRANFQLSPDQKTLLSPNRRLPLQLRFQPIEAGEYHDTLWIVTQPCQIATAVILRATAISADVQMIPAIVQVDALAGAETRIPIRIQSVGSTTAVIQTADLSPSRSDWELEMPPLPLALPPGSDTTIYLVLRPQSDTTYRGQLCLSGEQQCRWSRCVEVVSLERQPVLAYAPAVLLFPEQFCEVSVLTRQLVVWNAGDAALPLDSITLQRGEFSVTTDSGLPVVLEPSDTVEVRVQVLLPRPGKIEDTLLIWTPDSIARIPVEFVWYQPQLRWETVVAGDGFLLYCEQDTTLEFHLRNEGSGRDTVDWSVVSGPAMGVSVVPDFAVVEPGENVAFAVRITASAYEEGNHMVKLAVRSRQCEWYDTVAIDFAVARPSLVFVPSVLPFPTIAAGKQDWWDTVYVKNPSSYFPVDVQQLWWEPVLPTFTVRLPSLPFSLLPNDSVAVPIRYFASYPDTSQIQLFAHVRYQCKDVQPAEIIGRAQWRIYRIELRVPNYEAIPGDTLALAVVASMELPELDLRELRFQLTFLPTIFTPLSAHHHPSRVPVPMQYDLRQGQLTFVLDSALLQGTVFPNWKKERDTLLWVTGVVNLAHPTESPLHLQSVQWKSADSVIVFLEDGQLRLRSICLLDARDIRLLPTFRVVQVPAPGPSVPFVLELDGPLSLEIRYYSLAGAQSFTQSLQLQPGRHTIAIPSALPAGTYLWEIRSPYERKIGQLWIVR